MNDFEFKKYLSSYLAAEKVNDLFESIRNFPQNINKIYTQETRNYYLQGDCVGNIPICRLNIYNNELITNISYNKVIILNNSCDMSESREGGIKTDYFYTPLLSMKKYKEKLKTLGNTDNQINNKVKDIKSQTLSNIMYFPPFQNEEEDYLVFFDKIFSCQYNVFQHLCSGRIFSLSNYGFYSLIFKMSVHFLRIREKEDRG